MNDEVYVPKKKTTKQKNKEQQKKKDTDDESQPGTNFHGMIEPLSIAYQTSGQISERLASEFNNIVKSQSARERARKASREIIKERNDTSGGGVVSERLSSELNNRESGGAGSRCLDTREAVVDPNIIP